MTASLSALQEDKMVNASKHCQLYYCDASQLAQLDNLQDLIVKHKLSLILNIERVEGKLNQKRRTQLSADSINPVLLLDEKNKLSWLSDDMSVAPEWDKLQRRVVSAGRKSELLLQAAKVTADSTIIDATAGFGHDSLILASTGAQVVMLEQQPLMALLLLAEQQRMSTQPNWQKLMARLTIINTNALSYFTSFEVNAVAINSNAIDVIYLDPMFPIDSYQDSKTGKGAKVGKQMQALHHIAYPPTLSEEQQLLQSAKDRVSSNTQHHGRVIVKRPQHAPLFANAPADESWHNTAVRFDGYFL